MTADRPGRTLGDLDTAEAAAIEASRQLRGGGSDHHDIVNGKRGARVA